MAPGAAQGRTGVTLYVPGFTGGPRWPVSWPPPLARLVARARASTPSDEGFAARLLVLLGLPATAGLAALARLGEGLARDERWWVRCDPVHLAVDGDRLLLLDNETLSLSSDVARRLGALVASVFAEEEGCVEICASTRWYLTLPHPEPLITSPIAEVAGRNVDDFLPRGNRRYWRTRLNEVQMLLHQALPGSHGGEAPRHDPNSVWLWGAGYGPQVSSMPGPYARVYGDETLVAGAAHAAGAETLPLPAGPHEVVHEGQALVVLRGAQGPAQYGDTEAWLTFLTDLTRGWLAPLFRDLAHGRLEVVRILGERGPLLQWRRRDLWRFWRSWLS